MLGEEGSDTRRHERAALDRRPARRHHELPLRHPAVGRLDRGRGRAGDARRRRLRPDARRAVGRRARRARRRSTARRSTAASTRSELATALVATGFGYEAEVRAAQAADHRPPAPARARHPPHGLGRDRPRVDRRRAATTPTSSAASRRGTIAAGALICEARRARGAAPESGASHGCWDPRRAARARGRARLTGRLIRAPPGYPPRHGHRRRHRLLHPAPHPRVPVPAPLAASRARRPEGDEHRLARSEQGARQARPVALEAVQHVEQGHLEVRQRRPARPQQGRLYAGECGARRRPAGTAPLSPVSSRPAGPWRRARRAARAASRGRRPRRRRAGRCPSACRCARAGPRRRAGSRTRARPFACPSSISTLRRCEWRHIAFCSLVPLNSTSRPSRS